jgi:hypothetical protein
MNRGTGRIAAWVAGIALVAVLGLLLAFTVLTPTLESGVAAYTEGDYTRALATLRPIADEGNPVAAFYLGESYRYGRGVRKDGARAATWYLKAANGGSPEAQFMLGMMYATGTGVERDYVQSYKWCSLAAVRLSPLDPERKQRAIRTRAEILARMSSEEVDRAKALVIGWDRDWQSLGS